MRESRPWTCLQSRGRRRVRLSRSSGTVHNVVRYRAAIEHDPAVIEAMARKAALRSTC